jgi:hypothetical protein
MWLDTMCVVPLLDIVYLRVESSNASKQKILDYLYSMGAESRLGNDRLLYELGKTWRDSASAHRLLDAGTIPMSGYPEVGNAYESRLRTRAVCIALLSLPRKVPPERRHVFQQCLPRDILVLIARMVWERRFEGKGAA